MVKRGRLTKVEINYIENSDLPIEDIAKDLDRSIESIEKYLPKTTQKPESKAVEIKEDNDPEMLKRMGRYKRNDQRVATIMTPSASEYADATRPSRIVNKKIQQSIHKPRG